VGNNFVGAQVEDVFGVNDLPSNGVDRCQFWWSRSPFPRWDSISLPISSAGRDDNSRSRCQVFWQFFITEICMVNFIKKLQTNIFQTMLVYNFQIKWNRN
jgi:hypothetical protein